MRQVERYVFMGAIALGLAACDRVPGKLLGATLEGDVRALLVRQGVAAGELACAMAASSRDGTCRFALSQQQAERLIAGLGLRPATDAAGQRLLEYLAAGKVQTCLATPPTAGVEVAFFTAGRAEELHLPGGSAFEYLVFTFDAREGKGCVQVSYAYG